MKDDESIMGENTVGSAIGSHAASDGGEPNASKIATRTMPHGTFAGMPYFNMSKTSFNNVAFTRRKGKHWKTYIGSGEDDSMMPIRNYAKQNQGKPILGKLDNQFLRLQ